METMIYAFYIIFRKTPLASVGRRSYRRQIADAISCGFGIFYTKGNGREIENRGTQVDGPERMVDLCDCLTGAFESVILAVDVLGEERPYIPVPDENARNHAYIRWTALTPATCCSCDSHVGLVCNPFQMKMRETTLTSVGRRSHRRHVAVAILMWAWYTRPT